MNHYSTDFTDNQWQVIEKFLDVQVRKRKYSLRSIANAIPRVKKQVQYKTKKIGKTGNSRFMNPYSTSNFLPFTTYTPFSTAISSLIPACI